MLKRNHHLVLIREADKQGAGSTCCGLEGDVVTWDTDGPIFRERRERMLQMGAIYRAVRGAFPDRVEITVLDPRNFLALAAILARDVVRFGLPLRTLLRNVAASGLATGIFDGELLFQGTPASPQEVVDAIAVRIELASIPPAAP
jgi:hypothetical protein